MSQAACPPRPAPPGAVAAPRNAASSPFSFSRAVAASSAASSPGPRRQRLDDQNQVAAGPLRIGITSREGKSQVLASGQAPPAEPPRRSRPIWYRGAPDQARRGSSPLRAAGRAAARRAGSLSGSAAIASAWLADQRRESGPGPAARRGRARGSRPVRPTALRLGRGAAAAAARSAASLPGGRGVQGRCWRPGRASSKRSSNSARYWSRTSGSPIAETWSMQPAPEARALLGRGERLGVELVPPEPVDQRFGRLEQRLERGAAAGADQIVGILARRQGDEAERAARRRHGAAPAAPRAPPPSARPRRRRSRGSGMGESRQSRPSWPSVSAVPSGATASAMPAWSSAITSIWPSTTITRRRRGSPGRPGRG